jgi:hypothetical protein
MGTFASGTYTQYPYDFIDVLVSAEGLEPSLAKPIACGGYPVVMATMTGKGFLPRWLPLCQNTGSGGEKSRAKSRTLPGSKPPRPGRPGGLAAVASHALFRTGWLVRPGQRIPSVRLPWGSG